MACGHSFVRRRPDRSHDLRRRWFSRWLKGETIEQLLKSYPGSKASLRRLLLSYLDEQVPPPHGLETVKYLIFDAKYLFGRERCLVVLMDAVTRTPIAGKVIRSETSAHIVPWLIMLRDAGLQPTAVTTDGRQTAIAAFRIVWPNIANQRCLFHIRMQVESWCRFRPRYASAGELKNHIASICSITSIIDVKIFQETYMDIATRHQLELTALDSTHPVEGDIIRAFTLVRLAMPHCFLYLDDGNIARTTSCLEGYFKQVQYVRGFQRNGLTKEHLQQFLAWKIYNDQTDKKHTK